MYPTVRAVRGAGTAIGALALLLAIVPTIIKAQATVYAEGITNPAGIYVDDNGYLWVSSLGSGLNDAGVYVVTPSGEVHPFITGLPSQLAMGEPAGTNHAYINNDTELIVVQGAGAQALSGTVFTIDTTGFSPGDDPRGPEDVDEIYPVSDWVIGELGGESNPYSLTFVPNSGDVYLADAAANAVIKAADGGFAIHAKFPNIPNTGSTGPPVVNVVPTGIEYYEGTIYVATLTGFPFNEGAASILAVDTLGNVTKYLGGLTTVVDLQVMPGGGILFLEHRFAPNTGRLYKYENEELTEVATGLDRPVGLRIGHSGEVYVSLLNKGQIVVVQGVVTAVGDEQPAQVHTVHAEAYPNPFYEGVNLAVDVSTAGQARLTVLDVLGRTVHRADFARLEVGTQRLRWDADRATIAPGTYLYRIEMEDGVADGVVVKQ